MIVERSHVFVLGAAKAGTTTLHRFLDAHADVCMSDPKEPAFFEAEYESGVEFYWRKYYAHRWRGEPLVGEARHRNLYLPYVPRRIASRYPHAKLLVILRHPVDRAWSHWWQRYARGQEQAGFDDAIAADMDRISSGILFEEPDGPAMWCRSLDPDSRGRINEYRTYVDSGYYADQILRYVDLFGWESLHIILLDDLRADPQKTLRGIFDCLRLAPPSIDVSTIHNHRMPNYTDGGRRLLGAVRATRVQKLAPKRVRATLHRRFLPTAPWPTMNQRTRADLLRHFAPHNRALGSLLRRDLSHWAQ
ncbi:MAG: sulfotransferase domain-containing protein [Actinobacteria bacterium]|nr:sulfotransferase domain-containing protein [Actinomycetota bacterium]